MKNKAANAQDLDAPVAGLKAYQARRLFTWKPSATQGGLTYRVCAKATDSAASTCRGAQHTTTVCVNIVVPRCLYKAPAGERLKDIGAAYGTAQRQLWALN